jgi:hypothetical protein
MKAIKMGDITGDISHFYIRGYNNEFFPEES